MCFVDPSVTTVSEGRLTDRCRRVEVGVVGAKGLVWQSFLPDPAGGGGGEITTKIRSCRSRRELSAVGGQLGLNVHSADGAFSAGSQPLIHARLMEEVHAR